MGLINFMLIISAGWCGICRKLINTFMNVGLAASYTRCNQLSCMCYAKYSRRQKLTTHHYLVFESASQPEIGATEEKKNANKEQRIQIRFSCVTSKSTCSFFFFFLFSSYPAKGFKCSIVITYKKIFLSIFHKTFSLLLKKRTFQYVAI